MKKTVERKDGDDDVHIQISTMEGDRVKIEKISDTGARQILEVLEASVTASELRARIEHAKLTVKLANLTAAAARAAAHDLAHAVVHGHGKAVSPPALGEFFISFLAPKNSAQAFLGDLEEMFRANAERYGERQARRKYWLQVGSSFAPLVWQWFKRIGFFTVLVDYVRAKIGL